LHKANLVRGIHSIFSSYLWLSFSLQRNLDQIVHKQLHFIAYWATYFVPEFVKEGAGGNIKAEASVVARTLNKHQHA
jgi:hypothetical protein